MADERCVYANVILDASSLCEQISVKLLTILGETFDQRDEPAECIVVKLFRWVALNGELHGQYCSELMKDIANVIKDRACEHGARYKGFADWDDFWDEKRLRTLKEARRKTQHCHLPISAISDIVPLLDEWKTSAKKVVKEWRE